MFKFLQPNTLDDAVKMLSALQNVRILGGGTDLIIALRNKTVQCEYLLDCKKIPELNTLCAGEKGLVVGAAVPLNALIEADIPARYDVLKQGAGELANALLRNRATLAGNICNASPGGDMLPPALALDGAVRVISAGGKREIPLKDFFTGVKQHVLRPDELIVDIAFPGISGSGCYRKKKRIRGHDLAQVGVAAFLADDGILRVSCGAVGPTPVVFELSGVTKANLASKKAAVIDRALAASSPIGDVRSSREYRLAMLKYLTGQVIDELSGRAEVAL